MSSPTTADLASSPSEAAPIAAVAASQAPALSSSPTSLSEFEQRALNRRVRKAETKKAEIQRRFNPQAPPPCLITEIYPPELYNNWVKTGRSEMQGRRPTMEDACAVETHFRAPKANQNNNNNTAAAEDDEEIFVGVYDGHGGSKASEYVGKELHTCFRKKLELFEKFRAQQLDDQQQSDDGNTEETKVKQSDLLNRVLQHMLVPKLDEKIDEIKKKAAKSSDDDDEGDYAEKKADDEDDDLVLKPNNDSDDDDDDDDDDDEDDEDQHSVDEDGNPILKGERSIEPVDVHQLSDPEVIMLLLRESFIETNDIMREKNVPAGTTASIAYFTNRRRCYVANVGDSRIVLFRNGQPMRLTVDHRPNDPDEVARIKETGGFVVNERVNGMLAVTRAIGDCFLEPMVTADPYTACVDLYDNQDEFMIVACDGVWDYVNDMDACNVVAKEQDPRVAAKALRDHAYAKGSTDNISVVVLRFQWNNKKSQPASPVVTSPTPAAAVATLIVASPVDQPSSAAPEQNGDAMPVQAVLPAIVPENQE